MILTDAGTIISICDKGQGENHLDCVRFIENTADDFITTFPCLTEAMCFLGKIAGWHGQKAIWNLVGNLPLAIHQLETDELVRMQILMDKYQDTPMDFADASLVAAAAESLKTNRIFTLDSDFYVYRINDTEKFEIIPK